MKIVPCKLCGGEAAIRKVERSDPPCRYSDWYIYCTKCGCHFSVAADGYYGRDYWTEEQVIQRWNDLHGGGHGKDGQPESGRTI